MKMIKIFMASPDDTQEERAIFSEVIDSINRSRAHKENLHLEPIVWEKYGYPELENPQEIINLLLSDAELLIVVFWNKFGAPTKNFPSGTMEEFSLACKQRDVSGTPSIKVYFRQPTPLENIQDIEELRKVFEFRDSIKQLGLYKKYVAIEDFRALLFEHINAWISEKINNPDKKSDDHKQKKVLSEPSACKELIVNLFKKIEKKYDGAISKIQFGLKDLDDLIGDLDDLNLLLVAGDISSGKTSLLVTLANNVAVENQVPTLFFSMKHSKDELMNRLISNRSVISADRLKRGLISKREDWNSLTMAAGILAESPLFIDDNTQMTTEDIDSHIHSFKMRHDVGLVILDGINYITDNKESIGYNLRIISRKYQIPIIASAQIDMSGRRGKNPSIDDLKSLGDLKLEVDTILMLSRLMKDEWTDQIANLKISVDKNMNGPLDAIDAVLLHGRCYSVDNSVRDDKS